MAPQALATMRSCGVDESPVVNININKDCGSTFFAFESSNCIFSSFRLERRFRPIEGFDIFRVTQPNVVGQFGLSEDYTPSHFTGDVANRALHRFVKQYDPWFLTVCFHNPH